MEYVAGARVLCAAVDGQGSCDEARISEAAAVVFQAFSPAWAWRDAEGLCRHHHMEECARDAWVAECYSPYSNAVAVAYIQARKAPGLLDGEQGLRLWRALVGE